MSTKPKRPAEDSAIALQYEITAALQLAFNLDERMASIMADELTGALRTVVGGRDVYVPAPSKHDRDEAIRKEFTGRNRDEVCAKWQISRSTFYEIIGRK